MSVGGSIPPRRTFNNKMKCCKKCGANIPTKITFEGKKRNLRNRTLCLECLPFLSIIKKKCFFCHKDFEGKANKKYCSQDCCKKAKSKRHNEKYSWEDKKPFLEKACEYCGNMIGKANKKTQRFCSVKCFSQSRKEIFSIPERLENSKRKIDKNIGYVRVYCPEHPEANTRGYVYEHRIIAEQMIGRRLKKGEIVHHKNRIRWDNRKENLEVMDAIEHAKHHAKERETK
jgi:hypothetical protein